jgi:spermidine synthase
MKEATDLPLFIGRIGGGGGGWMLRAALRDETDDDASSIEIHCEIVTICVLSFAAFGLLEACTRAIL